MDTKYFDYVLEIISCGSINKAAGRLHVSQPNLSTSIRNLEADLDFPFLSGEAGVLS